MNDHARPSDIVDTTDCFEAVSVFKSAKNFLFLLVLISLLITQAVFWLKETGYVETDKPQLSRLAALPLVLADADADPIENADLKDVLADASDKIEEQAQQAAAEVMPDNENGDAAEADQSLQPDAQPSSETPSEGAGEPELELPLIKQSHLAVAVRIANFIVLFAGTLYCLVLLMSVKISIAGRMGGMSHICRAFLYSLFFLVILVPWQIFMPGVLVGTVYLPAELFGGWHISEDSAKALVALYYLRFVGLWVLGLILLLNAQIRSGRWSKTILRRLGIVQ